MRLRLPSAALALLVGALTVSAFAAAPPTPQTPQQLGFAGTREEVLAKCKRVGLIPLSRPLVTGSDPESSTRVEAALRHALEQAGFTVVGSDAYTKAYDRFNHAVGGIYDPMSGNARKNAYQGVVSNAVREFFTQEQLGCIAYVRALDIKATTSDNFANWDGAVEYIDGQANSTLMRVWSGNTGNGTLPALSLNLQLLNSEGKVIFSRSGGVQLLAYFDRHHGTTGSDFLMVPRAKLLLDDQRIERALTNVTVPLRYTPEEILAGVKNPAINTAEIAPRDLSQPPAGIAEQHDSPLQVPRDQILASVHRVLLGPLTLGGFTPPPDVVTQMRGLVRQRLAALGWEVVETEQLTTILGAQVQQVGGFYDPMTGKMDPERMRTVFRGTIKAVGADPAPDALMLMTLTRTVASQKYANAAWDGTEQQAMTLGPVKKGAKLFGGSENPTAGEGSVAASSLHVLLRNADGTVLYDARGGIELVQQLSLGMERSYNRIDYPQHLTDRAPSELFKDSARNAHAVDSALRELVMSPEQIAAAQAAAQPQKH